MNQWINGSCNIYSFLLKAYPEEYRSEFSIDMMQVFRDETIARFNQKGWIGLLIYWLHIIPDFIYSVVVENVSSPTVTWGLMEPVPNKPLPWKGVFLVLLPCLVYLVAQISQFTGKFWYFAIYYWAGYLMMIPVLMVWAITRRFPIWGLIPLGIFYHVLDSSIFSGMQYLQNLNTGNAILNGVISIIVHIWNTPLLVLLIMGTMIFLLLRRYKKEYPDSKSFRVWLVVFAVFALVYIANNAVRMAGFMFPEVTMQNVLLYPIRDPNAICWQLYEIFVVVFLVCIGTLFLKQHGFFSIFVYVGYLLPKQLIGYPWNVDELLSIEYAMLLIGVAIISYRVLLSLIAPVWMSRAVSQNRKTKAVIIPIIIAISISFIIAFYQYFFFPEAGRITLQTFLFAAMVQLKPILGLFFAISLYRVISFPAAVKTLTPEAIF
jgi:hypothetical protein